MTRTELQIEAAELTLTEIHEAIKAAKAAGMDRTDPARFEFMAESYWLLRREIADRRPD